MESLYQSDSWVTFLMRLSFSHTESQDHHTDRKRFCEKGSSGCSQHTGEQSIRLWGLLFVILTQTRVTKERETSAEDLPPPDWPKSGVCVGAFPSQWFMWESPVHCGWRHPWTCGPKLSMKAKWANYEECSSLTPASVLLEFLPCLPSMIN